jgi:hypothetical protein
MSSLNSGRRFGHQAGHLGDGVQGGVRPPDRRRARPMASSSVVKPDPHSSHTICRLHALASAS